MEVNTEVPVRREEALVQVVQLVVVLHEQLQTSLVTTGRAHGLVQGQHTHRYTSNVTHTRHSATEDSPHLT